MRRHQIGALGAAAIGLVTLSACGGSSKSSTSSQKPSITIGSQAFTENEVLAYVYADALKADGFSVTVKPNLGQREVTAPALQSGQIDFIPEYLGNYLTFLNPNAGVLTVDQTYSTLKPLASAKGLTLGNYSQATDADAIAVTQANATKYYAQVNRRPEQRGIDVDLRRAGGVRYPHHLRPRPEAVLRADVQGLQGPRRRRADHPQRAEQRRRAGGAHLLLRRHHRHRITSSSCRTPRTSRAPATSCRSSARPRRRARR